jgi:hypothetical protein
MHFPNKHARASFFSPAERAAVAALAWLLPVLVCGCGAKAADDDSGSTREAGTRCPAPGTAQASECPKASDLPAPSAVIDDLEDQDGFIASVGERIGGWWTAGDETPGASIVPLPSNDEVAQPEAIAGGRCGSKFAMHVTGQGFLDWGALLGVSLHHGTLSDGTEGDLPYDASADTGIEFWARIGDTSTDRVRFAVSDINNEPSAGVCTENGGPDKECFDTFGTYLPNLETSWRHYRIAFSTLTQRKFGLAESSAATNALYTVQFNFDPASIFDLWVDDVAFY